MSKLERSLSFSKWLFAGLVLLLMVYIANFAMEWGTNIKESQAVCEHINNDPSMQEDRVCYLASYVKGTYKQYLVTMVNGKQEYWSVIPIPTGYEFRFDEYGVTDESE